ncbi:MAG: rod shape-determining protein MreC [Rikenellaceae bacterium]
MFQLLEFIRSTYVVVLFIIAEMVAISHYAWSSSYTRAKIFVVSNSMVGGVNGALRSTVRLFELPKANRELVERISQLEAELDLRTEHLTENLDPSQIIFDNPSYNYIVARVVSNSINKQDNYIVLDKGVDDGVYERMAVITPAGEMLGYVAGCTSHYSAALSLLSNSFTTSGKLLYGDAYGSIHWSGRDRYRLSMKELSKYESVNVGDTIVSTGFSNIFPGDVRIGTVASYEFNEMRTAYNVEIDLAVEMTSIDYVLLVGSRDSGEIEELLQEVESNN